MPVRLVCPSCSAALSVKDEFAGRAVKCPKCGGVIPPSQPAPPATPSAASPPPPAPPEPEKPATESPDESGRPKPGSKITAKPVARSADADEDRPRRKDRDDDDRNRNDRREKRRRRDEDDEEERPAKAEKKGGNTGVMIVGIICGTLILCCGGIGGGIYYVYYSTKKAVVEAIDKTNMRVTRPTYDSLVVGSTTRLQAEQMLGGGKVATGEDIEQVFGTTDAAKTDLWMSMVVRERAIIWRNADDFILVAFHPNAEGDARVQMKEWHPKIGLTASAGESSDTAFLQKYPVRKFGPAPPFNPPNNPPVTPKNDEPPPGPLPEITAADLAQQFSDNQPQAFSKHKDKWLSVTGKVLDVTTGTGDDTVMIKLVGIKLPNNRGDFAVWCYVRAEETKTGWDTARGQEVKITGRCQDGGPILTYVNLQSCRIGSKGGDPAVKASAQELLGDYVKNTDTANATYRDKETLISNARFVSASGDVAQFDRVTKGKETIRIQVTFSFGQRKQLEALKPGAVVKFRGECGGRFGDHVQFYRSYIVP